MANITKFNRYAIIYVDDEEKARKYFELTFKDIYQVLCADSVEAAISILETDSDDIALLITDQHMPKAKGMELIRIVKTRYPLISRMLTTAYADLGNAIESVNKGEIFRYVLKPWDIDEFKSYINEALQAYTDKKEEQQLLAERRQSIFKVASNIAHELRTPLAGIYATINGIRDDFPELVRGYKQSQSDTDEHTRLPTDRLKSMLSAFDNIERQVQHSQAMITILLENIRDDGARNISRIKSMLSCLDEALETYPFFKQQMGLVSIEIQEDFDFNGNINAMINIFHNMLKNSLYALQASNRTEGRISIRLLKMSDMNHVYFRDEGTGIPAEILPYIFDDFFSSKGHSISGLPSGNGIGLAFCKRALNSWSAEIECQSVLGEYTEFIMKFPQLEK